MISRRSSSKSLGLISGFLVVVSLITSDSSAVGSGCVVRQTHDGFAALRTGPSVRSKMLKKLKPGQVVGLHPAKKYVGKWYPVYFFGDSGSGPAAGYVHSSLLKCK